MTVVAFDPGTEGVVRGVYRVPRGVSIEVAGAAVTAAFAAYTDGGPDPDEALAGAGYVTVRWAAVAVAAA